MDDSYITERRSQAKSEDAVDGVVKGMKHLGFGLMKGTTGLVTNPYKEAMKGSTEGKTASGFMRGVGKGLIGAVVKPTAGVLDLASDVTSGIVSSTVNTSSRIQRSRPPSAPEYNAGDALGPCACAAFACRRLFFVR
eukprot:COSAG05_NODE_1852_length_3958_cov_1.907748_2_plen_137_part_00